MCRILLLSNGLKKARALVDKGKSAEKQSGKQKLLGVLPCQTGGGAHCVAWKGDELYAGEIHLPPPFPPPPTTFPFMPAQAVMIAAYSRGRAFVPANHEERKSQSTSLMKDAHWRIRSGIK